MKVVLASGNAGKVREFMQLLSSVGMDVRPQSEFDVPDADETGLTFVENAILKARNAAKITGLPAIADDSGIEVDALQGQPGIYSARYAGIGAGAAACNEKLLKALEGVPEAKRTARFRCCIVMMQHADDPSPIIAEGAWEGRILEQLTGSEGFGYDPLFFVPTHNMAAAEMDSAEKNKISHRGQALNALLERLS
ncbi:RdgB/HAM1 family non-canonical purine NTP pyrophosphatase [Leucothrix pacifica]|uniref:dITP/XTP pyrophosphatase n=1 Tax=Leucothrix pacifica TaxID=1247513 RepID=A0A317C327_9GAMM|nr:RdgB/HAM1 family non-canonical purine NTP pyrophosphatase [Leucothrix pacifica]PWQ93024.1 non-canonical purine NTP pyrophosphatase, RdgB/HAM1 family [Leucothrix pacifica]